MQKLFLLYFYLDHLHQIHQPNSSIFVWLMLVLGSFWALRWVEPLSYWSLKWNDNRNWQNQEKPEYHIWILVQANFLRHLSSFLQFRFLELTQCILGSGHYFYENDTSWVWQKGCFSSIPQKSIKRHWRELGLGLWCRWRCHWGKKWQRYRVSWPRSC